VTNDNYANGSATSSHGNMEHSTNSDGSINLAPIDVISTSLPAGYEWIGDLPDYTYEAFTYTNIGGMYDVGVSVL